MPPKSPVIKVTSPSFSVNKVLRQELQQFFPNSVFNTDGLHLAGQPLIDYLQGADAAVVSLDPIDDALLGACPKLKIIAKYGVGLDSIDQEACRRRNVAIGWTGGVNRRSVAELALCGMLGLCRNVFYTSTRLRNGDWHKNGGVQLTGRVVGIIGVGRIGKDVARLLEPFHCTVLANDIIEQRDYYRDHGLIETTKEEIYKRADVITLHVPLTPETHNMIDAKTLSSMKHGAFLINTCRGEVIDQQALKSALKNGVIAGAVLDVYESEPPTDMELLQLPNLVCTPHIGGNAAEAVLAMGRSAISHLRHFFQAQARRL